MSDPEEEYVLTVDAAAVGMRLDRYLAQQLPQLSRTRCQALIRSGHIETGGAAIDDPSASVTEGAALTVRIPPPEPTAIAPAALPLDILYEDDALLVVNKAAGMPVHPAAGHLDDTLVNALLHHCPDSLSGIGGVTRPGIVHRLDMDTSGVMVVAKTDTAHRHLAEQLATRQLSRIYLALCHGLPTPMEGVIDAPIGRHPQNRKKMAVTGKGKPARTHYRVLEALVLGRAALLECRLETGRTHQIRVHLTHLSHPLLGDPVYGTRRKIPPEIRPALAHLSRQALHAHRMTLVHPVSGEEMSFEAEMPDDLQTALEILRKLC